MGVVMRNLAAPKLLVLIACTALLSVSQAEATTFTYTVDIVDGGNSVTGTIQTNALGALNQVNITDWNLKLTDGASTGNLLGPLSGNNSIINLVGTDLAATTSGLFFNFGDTTTSAFFRLGSSAGDVVFNAVDIFQAEAVCGMGCVTPAFLEIRVDPAITDNVAYPSMNVEIATIATTPLPATLPLFATGLGALGLLGWRRKRKVEAAQSKHLIGFRRNRGAKNIMKQI